MGTAMSTVLIYVCKILAIVKLLGMGRGCNFFKIKNKGENMAWLLRIFDQCCPTCYLSKRYLIFFSFNGNYGS